MKSGFQDAVNWRAVGARFLFFSLCAFLFVAGLAGPLVEPFTRVPAPASVISLSSLTVNPTSVNGGIPSIGTVMLNSAAPVGGAQVVLSSNNPVAGVPPNVTVPAGSTSANFTVSTAPVSAPTVATISASYGGVTQSATLDVTPPVAPGDLGPFATPANVTVSSQNTATGQLGIKAFDGSIDGSPGDPTKEWATLGQLAGAWIQLTWSGPGTISKLILNDRPNLQDNVLSGTLSFSDGSSVPVGPLPNDGTGLLVTFPPKTGTWVRFSVTSAVGSNIGLAEFQVFATSTAVSPRVAVLTFTQTPQFQADFASKRPRNVTLWTRPSTLMLDAARVPLWSTRACRAMRWPTARRAEVWTSATLEGVRATATRWWARCTLRTTPLASAADGARSAAVATSNTIKRFMERAPSVGLLP